jgi:hypothetical protein
LKTQEFEKHVKPYRKIEVDEQPNKKLETFKPELGELHENKLAFTDLKSSNRQKAKQRIENLKARTRHENA